MNACLRDRRLFLLTEGEGSAAERRHVLACPDCRERQRGFTRVAGLATRVLLEGPPPEVAPSRVAVLAPLGWRLPAAVLATGLALAWLGVIGRGPKPEPETAMREPSAAYAALALNDVSSSLFAVDDGVWRSDQDADTTALQAALRGEWPCDGAERMLGADCD